MGFIMIRKRPPALISLGILLGLLLNFNLLGQTEHSLKPSEKASLRFHLENLSNEIDLLIRNQKIDRSDVKKQERDFANLRTLERIPLKRNIPSLKSELIESAKPLNLQLQHMETTGYSPPGKKIPSLVLTSDPPFRLNEDQLVEKIQFTITVQGTEDQLNEWVHHWPNQLIRYVEFESKKERRPIHSKAAKPIWILKAHTFRFREIRFPKLRPKNPRDLLPAWAKQNPGAFSAQEPVLWSFVKKIEQLAPQATPCYDIRSQFLLNDARLSFFLSKSGTSAS